MNILFLTLSDVYDINEHDIYQDLMRCFARNGHHVYVVCAAEQRKNLPTLLYDSCGCQILRVKVGNQSNCSLITKGISTVLLQFYYLRAIRRHLSAIAFDLILYATPPITFTSLVTRLRKNACSTYLMLKDIFPQNAVDLNMMREGGMLHRYFRRQEKKLYKISDFIGCMSPANVRYLLEHNSLSASKVEICPNGVEVEDILPLPEEEICALRMQYSIPADRMVLIYGGNLGKPQGIPFLMKCLEAEKDDERVFFVIVGGGSEYKKLKAYLVEQKFTNVLLLDHLPRGEYFKLIKLSDVGLVFLDSRFTIPNFPSRILPYMEYRGAHRSGVSFLCQNT